ncbi:MAG: tRNA (guanosine(37)-N1)-methyltransferase TrmD [Arsenophonus endosymbiont of Ceratovacuna japonica]
MKIGIISLFPEIFCAITKYGIISNAIKNNLLNIQYWNPRDYTNNKRRTVDNRPYGGGPGMLMMAQPIVDAINAAKYKIGKKVKVIYLSPQGRKLDQQCIYQLIKNNKLILVCGRYKGIDERVIQTEIDEELSIGDYVLSGGELPAMVMIDAISRFIPGVLGNTESAKQDSFITGLLDYPHYTRPKLSKNIEVPNILLSGNHSAIKRWREKQSLGQTWLKRPELLINLSLTNEQNILLKEFQQEYKQNNILCISMSKVK